jgi:hypothetical protein
MENKLIIEINQIRSNMGLPVITEDTNILLESTTTTLASIFNTLVRSASSVIKSEFSAAERALLRKVIKGEVDDLSDDAIKLEFANLMKTSKGVKAIQELRDAVKSARNRRTNPIDDTTETYFNRLLNKMENTKTSWIPKKTALEKTFAELGGLTSNQVKWLEKIHGKNWIKPFYSFFNSVKSMFKSEETLLNETLELIKQLSIDTGSTNIANYRKQISLNFEKLTKMRRDNFVRINDWITKNVPPTVRKRLDKENLNGYGKAKKLATGAFEKEFEKEYGTFNERIGKFWSQMKDMTYANKKRIEKKYGSKSEMWGDLVKLKNMSLKGDHPTKFGELKADFWYGSTLVPSAWREYYGKAGLTSAVKKYIAEYATVYIKINLMIAGLELAVDVFAKIVEDWYMFEDFGWVQSLSKNYNKNYYNAIGLDTPEQIEKYKQTHKNVKVELETVLKLYLQYAYEQFNTWESLIPGFADNVIVGIKDMILWLSNPDTKLNKEDGEKVVEKVKPIIEDSKQQLDSLKNKLEEDFKRKTDSINNLPIPAPVDNDTIITPEKIKTADESGF